MRAYVSVCQQTKNDVHLCIQGLLVPCVSMQRNQRFYIFSFLKSGLNIYKLIRVFTGLALEYVLTIFIISSYFHES